jgi:soluble lytic murein transglycosylase
MKVPTYDNLQVGANTLPTPSFRPATTNPEQARTLQPFKAQTTPDIAGRQLQQTGETMQKLGSQIAAYQIEAEKNVAQVRVDDALNKAKEAALRLTHDKDQGYTNIRGNAALERQSGLSLEDEYTQNLVKEIRTIGEGLGTDAQKAMFSQRASELATNFRAGAMRHSADEYKSFSLSVSEGAQKLAIDQIAKDYSNPTAVTEAVDTIKAHVYREAQLTGKSATWQEARVLELTSTAHKVAIASALDSNDLSFAVGYMKQHAKEIDPVDMLPLRKAINTESNKQLGAARADIHLQGVRATVDPNDFDRVVNITIKTESNGNPNAVSPKGAKGLMQVMDATNKSPGYGIAPAKDNSPEERVRVGKDYMRAMVKEYGRLDQAWAAYNAGPGAVNKAVKKAEQAADKFRGVGPDDYLAYLPKETQDYVAKNMAAYEGGEGKQKAKTIEEVDAALRADPYLARNPDAYKVARERAETTLRDMNNTKKIRDDEALAAALDGIEKNGGSYSKLPTAILNAVPRDKLDTVRSYADKVSKQVPVETDWKLYYELRTDPQNLAMVNLGSLKGQFADSEFKQLVDLQQSKDTTKQTVIRSAEEVLKNYMVQAGINPNPKSEKDAEKVGRVFSEFETKLNAFEAQQGKKATSKDAEEIAARMFTKVETAGFLWNSSKVAANLKPGDKVVVPPVDRKQIIDALTEMKKPVTEENIQTLYRRREGF